MRTQRSWRARRATLIGLAVGVAACDIPSSPPIFQQTWVVPADSVQVGVSQILPANIALNGGGTAFVVSVASPSAFASTLGTLCAQPACQSPGTVNAPVPAFTSAGASLTRTVNFPATVASATVTAGSLNLQINNTLGFDPLRPNGAGGPYGTIAVTITNGATNTTTNFSGVTQTLANGASTNLVVPIPAGTYGTSFSIAVALNVPAGSNADLAASNGISILASVTGLTVSAASVVVNSDSITTTPNTFDMEDVEFGDEIESGAILLDVLNPFTATAALLLEIRAPAQGGQPLVLIAKPLNIPATATSTATIGLTGTELRSLVGKQGVNISVRGTASGTGAGNTVSVTPTQMIKLRTQIQLLINVGG